jgi:CubicO group peptidase (beta-lactamase class C family)
MAPSARVFLLSAALGAACVANDDAVGQAPDAKAAGGLTGTWDLKWRRSTWAPRNIAGVVRFVPVGDGWSGSGRVEQVYAGRALFTVTAAAVVGEAVTFTLRVPVGTGTDFQFAGTLHGGAMEGSVAWIDDSGHAQLDAFHADHVDLQWVDEQHDAGDKRLAVADPASTGLDPVLVDQLVLAAQDTNTDALVVLSDGKIVCERYFGRERSPMPIASITKAVSNLALGFLVDEGKIPSLDAPLSRWFPEFAQDDRADITLRHLLTHTTGLTTESTEGLNKAPDQVAYARAATRAGPAGAHFAYNNRAMELVSGIVRAEAGEEVEAVIRDRVFEPLGVGDYTWFHDGSGHTATYGGLRIDAVDLAVLGQMLADGGMWRGKPIVPASWVQAIQTPGVEVASQIGLTWWLSRDRYAEGKPVIGFGHSGDGGQYLYVYPAARLVGVRFAAIKTSTDEVDPGHDTDEFPGFQGMMERIAIAKTGR